MTTPNSNNDNIQLITDEHIYADREIRFKLMSSTISTTVISYSQK